MQPTTITRGPSCYVILFSHPDLGTLIDHEDLPGLEGTSVLTSAGSNGGGARRNQTVTPIGVANSPYLKSSRCCALRARPGKEVAPNETHRHRATAHDHRQ